MSVTVEDAVSDDEALRQARVNASGILARGGDPRLLAIVEQAREELESPIAYCSIPDGPREWVPAAAGLDSHDRARSDCFYEQGAPPPSAFGEWAAIRHPSGIMLGALCVIDEAPRAPFSREQQELLEGLAAALAKEICDPLAMRAYGSWAIDLLVEQLRVAAAADRDRLVTAIDAVLREVEQSIAPLRRLRKG